MLRTAVLLLLLLLIACDSSDPISADSTDGSSGTSATQETAVPTSVSTEAANPTPTNTPQATPISTAKTGNGAASATVTPSVAKTPPPRVSELEEFVDAYGYPESADFGTLIIERLGIEAKIAVRKVNKDQDMPNPYGPADVVLYDLSDWPDIGGMPGSGNMVLAGHRDYSGWVPYAGVRFGPSWGVFQNLNALGSDDRISLEYQGERFDYEVARKWIVDISLSEESTNPSEFWVPFWQADPGVESITLYTCAGQFSQETSSYDKRVIVRAVRVGSR